VTDIALLRRAREAAGLTQAQLAARAGVSRQLVGAAEAGRHAPSVQTALRIARALGRPVEDLFALPGEEPAPAAGGLAPGTPVALGRVGGRLVAHPLASLVAGDAAWAAPDGVVDEDGAARLLPGGRADALVVVGCDPLLGLCAAMLAAGPGRLAAIAGTSGDAVDALAEGRAHAALVHGPDGALPPPAMPVRRVHVARWRVGLGVSPAHDRGALEPLLRDGVPIVQREASAASQQALERAAGDLLPAPVARAAGHVPAARHAALAGCAAVTFEPAALQHGLGFVPLEEHVVELWVGPGAGGHPGAEALERLLRSDALRRRVALVGGYDMEGAGEPARLP
jgi:DNA-binding XRE family transcriptional regulator